MSDNNSNTTIKRFNVKIKGSSDDASIFNIGANATDVDFSENATDPFKQEKLENSVPDDLNMKASNIIYGNSYLRNTRRCYIDGVPNIDLEEYRKAFGETGSDINPNHDTTNAGGFSIAYGVGSVAAGHNSSAIGFDCEANGWASHTEGFKTTTGNMSNYSHAEGEQTNALHNAAHAEGKSTKASGYASHIEGIGRYEGVDESIQGEVQGAGSHVEGYGNVINAKNGITTSKDTLLRELTNPFGVKNGQASHAEGFRNKIDGGVACHVSGMENTINQVYVSTATGRQNTIGRDYCFAAGIGNTIESEDSFAIGSHLTVKSIGKDSFAIGRYNDIQQTQDNSAFTIGGGQSDSARSNLLTIKYPKNNNAASSSNKGTLDGKNLEAEFGLLKGNVQASNNKWAHVGWDMYGSLKKVNGYNTWVGPGFSILPSGYLEVPHIALSIWLNETNKMLFVLLTPFDGVKPDGGAWDISHDKSGASLDTLGGSTRPLKYWHSNGSEEDFQKISTAVKNTVVTHQTATYLTEGDTSASTSSCKLKLQKLFGWDWNKEAQVYNEDVSDAIRVHFEGNKWGGNPPYMFYFPYN